MSHEKLVEAHDKLADAINIIFGLINEEGDEEEEDMPVRITAEGPPPETPIQKEISQHIYGVQQNGWAVLEALACRNKTWDEKRLFIEQTLMDSIWQLAKIDRIVKAEEG